jgi:hypothetical protein
VVLSDDLNQNDREQIEQAANQEMQTPETALIAKLEAEQVRKAMASSWYSGKYMTLITAPSPRSPHWQLAL